MMTERDLPVTLFGTHVGELTTVDNKALLRWAGDAEERWGLNSPVLSRNLRVSFVNTDQTESFFGALLPEGRHLSRLATSAQTVSSDLVGLLRYVGADLAGALRVGHRPDPIPFEVLSSDEVAALLSSASGYLVGGGGSALPGFQRKLTLTRDGGQWLRGNGAIASTHILKPVDAQFRSSVESEHYVLQIAQRLGLAMFETWVERIGDLEVLVIERYDRRRNADGQVERLHQEDAGQALGLPWGGNDKFERNNPASNLKAVAELLDLNRSVMSRERYRDRLLLLQYTTLNIAVGNTDAHAKNFSLLHNAQGNTRLAPFYDGAPLGLDYSLGTALAMNVNGVSQLPDVTSEDLVAEAGTWGLPAELSRQTISRTLGQIVDATRAIEPHESIEKHVPGYIRGQAENLARGDKARILSPIPLMAMTRLGTPDTRVEQGLI